MLPKQDNTPAPYREVGLGQTLDTTTLQRLVRLLGMLGSAHDGEVANAGRMADRLIRQHGMTWAQVILPILPKPPPQTDPYDEPAAWRDLAHFILDRWGDLLRERERHFVEQMTQWRGSPTEKQQAWLRNIAARFRGRT